MSCFYVKPIIVPFCFPFKATGACWIERVLLNLGAEVLAISILSEHLEWAIFGLGLYAVHLQACIA